jgi:DegV family protein with EDD domain
MRLQMQIVSDRGMDLAPSQWAGIEDIIHLAPLVITLDGVSYRSGVDIQQEEFYAKLAATESFPTTSQPSAGDFATLYREIAVTDPEIISIHISSGLSGTINAAREGARMVPEANVTFIDTLTLSGAEGWQVERRREPRRRAGLSPRSSTWWRASGLRLRLSTPWTT